MAKRGIRVQPAASHGFDNFYRYTRERWGHAQAERYINGLFAPIEGLRDRSTASAPVPVPPGVSGYSSRYQHHFVCWREPSGGGIGIGIGIVTILHERMHRIDRLREDFDP